MGLAGIVQPSTGGDLTGEFNGTLTARHLGQDQVASSQEPIDIGLVATPAIHAYQSLVTAVRIQIKQSFCLVDQIMQERT
jgi:hypothetical protein